MFQLAAVQVSPSQLAIENFTTGYCQDLKTDIHIKGVFVTKVSSRGCYITAIVLKIENIPQNLFNYEIFIGCKSAHETSGPLDWHLTQVSIA